MTARIRQSDMDPFSKNYTTIADEFSKNRKEILRKPNNNVEVPTLQDLIAKLHEEFNKDRVDIDYVNEIMTAYKSSPQDWKKYAKFDRYRYESQEGFDRWSSGNSKVLEIT